MDQRSNAMIERRTLSVEAAGKMLGLSRPSAYEACRRGDIPTIRIGRRVLVPRAKLLQMLGEELAPSGSEEQR